MTLLTCDSSAFAHRQLSVRTFKKGTSLERQMSRQSTIQKQSSTSEIDWLPSSRFHALRYFGALALIKSLKQRSCPEATAFQICVQTFVSNYATSCSPVTWESSSENGRHLKSTF